MSTAKRLTPNKIANLVMADEAWHDSEYVAASDYDALRAELAALRAEKVSQCGHPSSLMLRSAETGKALYCELCDERKRRRDAESMEEHYKARAEKAEAERESAHAAQRHAEKELSQYMAWYAMAEHQHLHEQRRAEKAEAERDAGMVAVKAMHKLLDRDWAIVDRDITLKCESHDQAWNYLHEMRDLVRAALPQEGEG